MKISQKLLIRYDCKKNFAVGWHLILDGFYLVEQFTYRVLMYEIVLLKAEVRKREEKEAAEALKREQELREAKRQQQRLNFLLSQTELYSHFMQNKTSQPAEVLTVGEEKSNDQEILLGPAEAQLEEEEDLEDAELRKEALRAAQDAVSKQKRMTSAFDSECLKLRLAADIEAPLQDASVAESSNIDLLHPWVSFLPTTLLPHPLPQFFSCIKTIYP